MAKISIGIDPGLSGAVGIHSEIEDVVFDMPTLTVVTGRKRSRKTGKMTDKKKNVYDIVRLNWLIRDIITKYSVDGNTLAVWLEKSQAMPDQGGVSNFNYGVGYGILQAVITCNEIPLNLVHPKTWKSSVMRDMGKEKDAAVYRATQLFPSLNFYGPQGGKKDGRAEAMLIAYYGMFQHSIDITRDVPPKVEQYQPDVLQNTLDLP